MQSTLNLWWALNLVIPVWWFGIRLMSLPAPGLQSGLLPAPTFILGSLVRCYHWPTLPWNQGVRIMLFWIRLLLTLNKAWTPSSLIHSRHQNWILPWMSLMPLHLLQSVLSFSAWFIPFLIILSCSLLLAFELINCGAMRALLAPVSLATQTSASKLICYFSSHPAAFGFWASTPPDNISLEFCQQESSSVSQIFRLVLGPLLMVLLTQSNSFLASGLPLLILFPHCPRLREMLYLCLKCGELILRIHDILDKAISKWVGNSACILAHLFNSVSR